MNGLVVGLTGGIGSGKSAAADLFSRLGPAVVDSDVIAHELTAPGGGAMAAIDKAFGAMVIGADGSLNRPAMRQLAFADLQARRRLEDILHPLIGAESDRLCAEAFRTGAPYVVLVVPLLIESADYRRRVSRVLVVDADDELRVARVASRSGLTRAEILSVMATQASRQLRLDSADDIIRNDGTFEDLAEQVDRLHGKYLALQANGSVGATTRLGN
jgi:dephospho-CoA kinase